MTSNGVTVGKGHGFADNYEDVCARTGHDPNNDPLGKSVLSTYRLMDILEDDLLWRIATLTKRVDELEENE